MLEVSVFEINAYVCQCKYKILIHTTSKIIFALIDVILKKQVDIYSKTR